MLAICLDRTAGGAVGGWVQGAALGDVVDVKETVAVLVRYASGPFQGHGPFR